MHSSDITPHEKDPRLSGRGGWKRRMASGLAAALAVSSFVNPALTAWGQTVGAVPAELGAPGVRAAVPGAAPDIFPADLRAGPGGISLQGCLGSAGRAVSPAALRTPGAGASGAAPPFSVAAVAGVSRSGSLNGIAPAAIPSKTAARAPSATGISRGRLDGGQGLFAPLANEAGEKREAGPAAAAMDRLSAAALLAPRLQRSEGAALKQGSGIVFEFPDAGGSGAPRAKSVSGGSRGMDRAEGRMSPADGTSEDPPSDAQVQAFRREVERGYEAGERMTADVELEIGRKVGVSRTQTYKILDRLADEGRLAALSNGEHIFVDIPAGDDAGGPLAERAKSHARQGVRLLNSGSFENAARAAHHLEAALADFDAHRRSTGGVHPAEAQVEVLKHNAALEVLAAAVRDFEAALRNGRTGYPPDKVRRLLSSVAYVKSHLENAYYDLDHAPHAAPGPKTGEWLSHMLDDIDPARFADRPDAQEIIQGIKIARRFAESLGAPPRLRRGEAPPGPAGSGRSAANGARGAAPTLLLPARRDGEDARAEADFQDPGGNRDNPLRKLRRKLIDAGLPDSVRPSVASEYQKLLAMRNSEDSEGQKLKTYLEWIGDLPWSRRTQDNFDIARARELLDRDHAGLEMVKERVLEFLAVRKKTGSKKGAIIAFVGPPGVGKTSIASGIAEALGRRFVRLSLGGIADETELRGHGRTYLGSMPGSVIRQMKNAGSVNPVMLLDEVDKVSQGRNGDPMAALLEILDPAQNGTFRDHYIDLPYDLSEVLFVVTANDLDSIPAPLRDRMEIIEFSGYTNLEKIEIAERHIVPEKRAANGLSPEEAKLTRGALRRIIEGYTLEAGVRALRQKIDALMRKIAAWTETRGEPAPAVVDEGGVEKYLGAPRFNAKETAANDVGVATGLAVSDLGGSTLNVEAVAVPGTGQLRLRKQMLEMIDDSAHNAFAYVKSIAEKLGIPSGMLSAHDLEVAFTPAGKIDGPSAGTALATAIASRMTGRKVVQGIAMTGEITLTGRVLPIGGLKQKALAAHRAGYRTVLFPAANLRDVEGIPKEVRDELELLPVSTADEVFARALEPAPAR